MPNSAVKDGTLVLTAGAITMPDERKLTYRISYVNKEGDRQTSNAYMLSLFP
jgi:hypothetical protein